MGVHGEARMLPQWPRRHQKRISGKSNATCRGRVLLSDLTSLDKVLKRSKNPQELGPSLQDTGLWGHLRDTLYFESEIFFFACML